MRAPFLSFGVSAARVVETVESLPLMTGSSSPAGYACTASTAYDASFAAWLARDGNNSTFYANDGTAPFPQWWEQTTPTAIVLGALAMRARSDYPQFTPKNFRIIGISDTGAETNLLTVSGQTNWSGLEERIFYIPPSAYAAFKRHRIYTDATNENPYGEFNLRLLQAK